LETAKHGLRLSHKTSPKVAHIIEQMHRAEPVQRIIYLLQALQIIADSKDYQTLSPSISLASADLSGQGKIKLVFEYALSHYNEPITLEDVASIANMSRASFCRYFKSKTRKTFVSFLMEVRISNACRLLAEQDKNVSEISYLCGYNHVSHFNNQFKTITGKTPLEYKREYRTAAEEKVI
jgi:AraC-like DNA-binding protein